MPTMNEEQLRDRHSVLVDKKFLTGLTADEAVELAHINHSLDEIEEPYYAEIKRAYGMMGVTLRAKRRNVSGYALLANSAKSSLSPSCDDCGLPYGEFGVDTVFSKEEWDVISGKNDGSVLLCGSCIAKRVSLIEGAASIQARIRCEP